MFATMRTTGCAHSAQRTVGTVVKTSEADDPIGIITVLNLQRYSTAGCLQEIEKFLLKHCKDADVEAKLEKVTKSTDVVNASPPSCACLAKCLLL